MAKAFNKARFEEICKSNRIFMSEICGDLGVKTNSTMFENPTGAEVLKLKSFFTKKHPEINFDYIMSATDNKCAFIDTQKLFIDMHNNGISSDMLKNYMDRSGFKNILDHIRNGSVTKKEASAINEYIDSFDGKGNRNTEAEEEKPKAKAKGGRKPLYELDSSYTKCTIDLGRAKVLLGQWKDPQVVFNLISPDDNGKSAKKYLTTKQTSISKKMLMTIMSFLRCDSAYLSGETKRVDKRKIPDIFCGPNDIYFPRYFFFKQLSMKDLSNIAQLSGIGKDYLVYIAQGKSGIRCTQEVADMIFEVIKSKNKKYRFSDIFILDQNKKDKLESLAAPEKKEDTVINHVEDEEVKTEMNNATVAVEVNKTVRSEEYCKAISARVKEQAIPSRTLGTINKICRHSDILTAFFAGNIKETAKLSNVSVPAVKRCYDSMLENGPIRDKFIKVASVFNMQDTMPKNTQINIEDVEKHENVEAAEANSSSESHMTFPNLQTISEKVFGTPAPANYGVFATPVTTPNDNTQVLSIIESIDSINDEDTLKALSEYINGKVMTMQALKKLK